LYNALRRHGDAVRLGWSHPTNNQVTSYVRSCTFENIPLEVVVNYALS
jgi:hypothetical protein